MVAHRSLKQIIKSWLNRTPRLFELVLRAIGKPTVEMRLLISSLHHGDTVFDIGANMGQFVGLFSRLVGPTGSVHVFEPIPPTFLRLEKNIASQHLPGKIYLNQMALADHDDLMTMYVPNNHYTEGSLHKHLGNGAWIGDQGPELSAYSGIRVITLDHYCENNNVGKIAMIKCDVEGAELLVLKGGAKSLLRTLPMLMLECYEPWTRDFGYKPQELFQFLTDLAGYKFWHIGKMGLQVYEPDHDPLPGSFPEYLNFLCAVPQVHGKQLGTLTKIIIN